MATKTGYKQATVAYKVRASDGAPVDINDVPISESGNKQAIALLYGSANPNPALYQVQLTYPVEGSVDGVPTVELSEDCATGYIFLAPVRVVLLPTTAPVNILVTSSGPWIITPNAIAAFSTLTGLRGETTITVGPTATYGEADIVFTNTITGQTAKLHIINASADTWILQTGFWNNLGFWHADGVWNY